MLCKHMIALAIASVFTYRPKDTSVITIPLDQAVCSGKVRDITNEELKSIKSEINIGMRLIKSYNGPSKKWFAYQDSLIKGRRLLLLTLSKLPVCRDSTDMCIAPIEKLDDKLANSGIDDSDGTVGGLVSDIMGLLCMFKQDDPSLKQYIIDKFPKQTNFEWENQLFIILS